MRLTSGLRKFNYTISHVFMKKKKKNGRMGEKIQNAYDEETRKGTDC